MKDYFGKELKEGDKVLSVYGSHIYIEKGTVERFTAKRVVVEGSAKHSQMLIKIEPLTDGD